MILAVLGTIILSFPVLTANAIISHNTFSCSLTGPGNGCGRNEGSPIELATYVQSTSPSTNICAGYAITAGNGAGNGYCTKVSGSGSGLTFTNDGTQTVASAYIDCTTSLCDVSSVATSGTFTDTIYTNAPPP